MAFDAIGEIDDLRNTPEGNISGFSIETIQAEQLGINVRIDEQFGAVRRGRFIALIWDGSAYRWITFDDIMRLTWNLSNPIMEREHAINNESANSLVEHGTLFRVANLPRNNE